MATYLDPATIDHIAQLANLPLTKAQSEKFAPQITSVLEYTTKTQAVDTTDVEETSQVTGLENVWREDVVDSTRTLTQEEALSQATHTHDGYFIVPQLVGE